MPKHLLRDHQSFQRPSDSDARASAGRIVDVLQQLVLARPDMIVALEEIVNGLVENHRARVVTQMWERQDEVGARARPPLPPVPLSELPAMLALLEPSGGQGTARKRTGRLVGQHKPGHTM